MSDSNKENLAYLLTTPAKKGSSSEDNNHILLDFGTPNDNNKTTATNTTEKSHNNVGKNHNLLSIKKIMTTPMKRMTPLKRIAPSSKQKTANPNKGNKVMTPMNNHSNITNKLPLGSAKKKITGGKMSCKRPKLTPPRSLEIGCSQKKAKPQQMKPDNIPRMSLSPHFLNLQRENSNYKGDHELRSSEMDPSPLQLELPSLTDVKLYANVCSLMDNYIEIGGIDFDFSALMYIVGTNTSHHRHRRSHSRSSTIPEYKECLLESTPTVAQPIISREEQDEIQSKKQAVQTELTNIQDDLTVQGFFREYIIDKDNPSGLGRVEACIFSTEKLRKIIVCFRGSNDCQKKPIQGGNHSNKLYSSDTKQSSTSTSSSSSTFSSDKDKKTTTEEKSTKDSQREFEKAARMNINAEYSRLLSANNLEDNLLTLLKRLSALKPFHDIVITGHTFGASLATMASQRIAIQEPTMRIYCQVFGSPKVGGSQFRQLTHSLPNLNFIRVERNADPFLCKPEGAEWAHVGHSIMLQSQNVPLSSGFPSLSESSSNQVNNIQVLAYRFDKRRPENSKNIIKHGLTKLENYTKGKIGNELHSYMKDLEKVHIRKIWVNGFVGEDVGDGICGDDDEIRYLV